MEAFPAVLEKIPNARLIVAGGNHPAAAGYWESVRASLPPQLPVDFLGYIPQKDVPELFRTSSLLVMPYDSSTGSSGPAHQACEYGLPIVCSDISDFRCMATDDDMAILFYKAGDASDFAEKIVNVLGSPQLQLEMSEHNYQAGVQMAMANVARTYLRWFELHKLKKIVDARGLARRFRPWSVWTRHVGGMPVQHIFSGGYAAREEPAAPRRDVPEQSAVPLEAAPSTAMNGYPEQVL
jgi:glycosyltransferase involved in cell wall biosynthesis